MKYINKFTILFFSIMLFSFSICKGSDGHSSSDKLKTLDNKIVEAFNASPKQTANVYLYSLEMINQAQKSSDKTEAWNLKARKLITLACYNEASAALTDGNLKYALIWCERGSTRGAKRGRVSDYNISWFYDNLLTLKENIESKLYAKGESVSKYSLRQHANRKNYPKESQNWKIGKRKSAIERANTYNLLAGPLEDAFGTMYVLIKTRSLKKISIKYYKNKGWGYSTFGNEPSQYFETWQECAEDVNANN